MTRVREAAEWLRSTLPADGTPMDGHHLRRLAERDGIAIRSVQRAKERAGVDWRRENFGGETVWFIAGPPTPNYRPPERPAFRPPKPRGYIEPVTWSATEDSAPDDCIGLCGACGMTWVVDGADPGRCRTLGCNRLLERIEREVVGQDDVEKNSPDVFISGERIALRSDVQTVRPGSIAPCPACARAQFVASTGRCIYAPACRGVFRLDS